MKIKNYLLVSVLIGVFALSFLNGYAQQSKTYKGAQAIEVTFVDVSPPIRDVILFSEPESVVAAKEIKNKFDFKGRHIDNTGDFDNDPVVQDYIMSLRTLNPDVVQTMDGVANTDNVSVLGGRVAPPDTQGDVGPDHYVQMTNLLTKIFDKDGILLVGPIPNNTFWQGFVFEGRDFSNDNDGDPVVLYDQFEDRWIVSHFAVGQGQPYYELIAVSQTSDPTGAYYRYAVNYGNVFPDYPKVGVWSDGIYISTRDFLNGVSFIGSSIVGLPKADLYSGTSTTGFRIPVSSTDYDHDGFLPADADGPTPPPVGTPHYSMFKPWGNGSSLYIATTTPDWVTPTNSTMTIDPITVAAYQSPTTRITQPNGQQLDAHSWALMYRLQYRNYGTHASMAAIHTVKAVSTGPYGIRWYEFRYPSGGTEWSVYQQGTFLPDDGENRWMGSIAMNGAGDIALGYSVTSTATHPSIRFTGQTSGAPAGLGVMDLPETSILAGTASQASTVRWGDYSMMSVDPTDDETFWYTQEYAVDQTVWGGWATKIAELNMNIPANLPIISVTPTSFTFDVVVDGTENDLLNIANIGLPGATDLTWSLSLAEPLPTTNAIISNGSKTDQLSINVKNDAESIQGDKIIRNNLGGNEGSAYDAIDPSLVSGQEAIILDPNYIAQGSNRSMDVLYDNGPLVNSPGTGSGGADESVLQSVSLGMNTLGFGHQYINNNKVADDFIVSDPGGWQIDEFVFYAYQSFAGNTSTITGVYYEIWDGDPSNPSSNIIYGDFSTNKLVSSSWANIYRVTETTSGNADRAVMENTASADIILAPGIYWIVWQTDGSESSGPWAPPITINGQGNTGNAKQSISGGLFNDALDGGSLDIQDFPFLVKGSIAVPPCPWLAASPESGTIAAGTSQDVTVFVDAAGLAIGTYDCELTITSNAGTVIIPVTLNVAEASSDVVTLPFLEDWETSNGTTTGDNPIYSGTGYEWAFETTIQDKGKASWGTNALQAHTGAGALTMDKDLPTSAYSINSSIITMNMSNYTASTGLLLSFWWVDHGDEEHSNDKVWIRGSNADAWVVAYDINPTTHKNHQYNFSETIDIDALLASAGQTVSETFQMRFGQEDNGPIPIDGISFDDILVEEIVNLETTLPFVEDWESYSGINYYISPFVDEPTYSWSYETDLPGKGKVSFGTDAHQVYAGAGAMTLDKDFPTSAYATNATILTLNLVNYVASTDLELSFYWTDHGDEEHPNDKVWIRGSESDEWVIAYDINPQAFANNRYRSSGAIDIDQLLASALPSQTVSSTFQVKFGQQDNGPIPADGISFDEITIQENVPPPAQAGLLAGGIGGNQQSNMYDLMNYPNPFKGTTTIQFTLENTNYTKLIVYNSLGVIVSTLFDGPAEGNRVYHLEFNSLDLPSGIYFYHLQTSDGVNTVKKMQLIK